ncbi:MAG: D-3-phosphoglycerate dehydrogenase [Chloroflexi bacterium]|jgi:D-3-phosphoglycerate dehydrogenase|nr:MAG: D-3-phosphoglycerate dehydrogenase [Chloroflexota bacterium]
MKNKRLKVYYIGQTLGGIRDIKTTLDKVGADLFILDHIDDESELISRIIDADGLITVYTPITRRVFSKLKNCKAVLRTGVGFDVVDIEAATEFGVAVINVPDMWTQEVANQALTLLLACNRKLLTVDSNVRKGDWSDIIPGKVGPLYGETLGVIGVGRIGSAFARRVAMLDLNIIGYDPYTSPELFKQLNIEQASLVELLSRSDYVSIHCPLNEETHHMINESMLNLMKPTAYLINTARGAIIDEEALIKALHQGVIAGAGLDAFEIEPPKPINDLLKMKNVVLSAHVGHFSDASMARRPKRFGEEIARVFSGQTPINLVNLEVNDKLNLK